LKRGVIPRSYSKPINYDTHLFKFITICSTISTSAGLAMQGKYIIHNPGTEINQLVNIGSALL